MTTRRAKSPGGTARGFWWQGALILLPVLVLAAACLWALNRDRRLIERDLVERAQVLADEAAQRVMAGFFPFENGNPCITNTMLQYPRTGGNGYFSNIITFGLHLVQRNPHLLVPSPARLPTEQFTEEQKVLWDKMTTGEVPSQGEETMWLEKFVASKPSKSFIALAEYEVGLSLLKKGRTNEAVTAFERVLPLAQGVITESGLPLKQLTQLRLLALLPTNRLEILREEWKDVRAQEWEASMSPEERRRRSELGMKARDSVGGEVYPWILTAIASEPSAVTEWMVEMADQRGLALDKFPSGTTHRNLWESWWRRHALSEACIAAWPSREMKMPYLFRVSTDEDFLIVRNLFHTGSTNAFSWFYALAQPLEASVVRKAMEGMRGVPSYVGFKVEVAGKQVEESLKGQVLATSAPLPLAPELQVTAVVANATVFRTLVRQRTFWFSAVVMVAAGVALAGYYTAWRAFLRQQRLAEMKSNFVSSVSHELRAPIASVRLMAESLESGKIAEPVKQQEYFRFISQECRRLSALIENVLDFARIEQGRRQYEFEPTDAVALVKATVQLLEPVAREQGITLQIEMEEAGLAAVQPQWDGRAIQQALINLLDNAIKYSPKGSRVTIALGQKDTALQLSVADEGVGIPPAEHQRIFERFYRVGSEMRREAQGVGIGLSIVKHIVEAHGGRVTVCSTPGQGSCFTMELPVHQTK